MQLHTNTLPQATARVLEMIKILPDLSTFYLTGGTALSLLLGHRESEDLDFFTQQQFEPLVLQQKLLQFGKLNDVELREGTLNGFLDTVKLQFLHYPYNLIEDLITWNTVKLSSVLDIACTKLITISMRGSKKDFIDLYVILEKHSLPELFAQLDKKYQNVQYNHAHILKSLVYFDDAEGQPMPRMHIQADWNRIKGTIVEHVKKFEF